MERNAVRNEKTKRKHKHKRKCKRKREKQKQSRRSTVPVPSTRGAQGKEQSKRTRARPFIPLLRGFPSSPRGNIGCRSARGVVDVDFSTFVGTALFGQKWQKMDRTGAASALAKQRETRARWSSCRRRYWKSCSGSSRRWRGFNRACLSSAGNFARCCDETVDGNRCAEWSLA